MHCMNARKEAMKLSSCGASLRSTVRIQALQRRPDMLTGGNHLSPCLASPVLLVIKRAAVLLREAVKQTEDGTCRINT